MGRLPSLPADVHGGPSTRHTVKTKPAFARGSCFRPWTTRSLSFASSPGGVCGCARCARTHVAQGPLGTRERRLSLTLNGVAPLPTCFHSTHAPLATHCVLLLSTERRSLFPIHSPRGGAGRVGRDGISRHGAADSFARHSASHLPLGRDAYGFGPSDLQRRGPRARLPSATVPARRHANRGRHRLLDPSGFHGHVAPATHERRRAKRVGHRHGHDRVDALPLRPRETFNLQPSNLQPSSPQRLLRPDPHETPSLVADVTRPTHPPRRRAA